MNDQLKAILRALNNRHLYQAILLMQKVVAPLGSDYYYIREQLGDIEQNYRYLLQFFSEGQEDPNREMLSQSMIRQAYNLFDTLVARLIKPYPQYDYMVKVAERYTPTDDHYSRLRSLFYRVWLSQTDTLPEEADARRMYVSALVVSVMQRFSEDKILSLISIARQDDDRAAQQALVGVVLACKKYEIRIACYPAIKQALSELYAIEDKQSDLRIIFRFLLDLALMSKADEEMDNLKKTIMPKMQKGGEKMIISLEEIEDDIEDSSEEQILLNGHRDRMAKLFKQGADLNYSTVKDMLTDRFFHSDIANWFMPFSLKNPDVKIDIETETGKMANGLIRIHQSDACDMDLYAFARMYDQLRDDERNIKVPDFVKEMGEHIDEEPAEEMTKEEYARSFIRTLYRFYYHNPWGINNEMADAVDICQTQIFKDVCGDKYNTYFANRMLKLDMYDKAEALLQQMDWLSQQKLGYALQKQKRFDEALQAYKRSLLMNEDSWTLQHIATCQRRLSLTEEALQSYEQLLEKEPDNQSFLLAKSQLLLDLDRASEALQVLFKLDMLYPDNHTIERGLGWCALLLDKMDTAERYLSRLLAQDDAEASDYINYGHLCLISGRRHEALQYYLKAREQMERLSDFFRLWSQDKRFLRSKKITNDLLILIEDTLLLLNSQRTTN